MNNSSEEYNTFVCVYCDVKTKTEKGIKSHIHHKHNVPFSAIKQSEVMHTRLYI